MGRLGPLLALLLLGACAPSSPPATPSPTPRLATVMAARLATTTPAPSPSARPPETPAPGQPTPRPSPPARANSSLTLPAESIDYVYALAARSRGYFAEEGLVVTVDVALPTIGIKSLLAGQQDFTADTGSGQEAVAQDAPLKIVMVAQARPTYGFFSWANLPTIADLRGKRLGIDATSSPAQVMAGSVLRKNGLDPQRDATWVPLGSPQNLWTALKEGRVDASQIGTADLPRPARDGFVDLKIYDDPSLHYAAVGLATTDRLLTESPELVRRMIRALARGVRFVVADRPGTLSILSQFGPGDRSAAGDVYDLTVSRFLPAGHIPVSDQAASLEVVRQSLSLRDTVPPARAFDLRLAREVDDELNRAGPRS